MPSNTVLDTLKEAHRNPTDWLIFREDCIQEGASNVPDTTAWEVVKDASAATIIEADQAGGAMKLTSAATTDNDGNLVQSLNEFWKPTAGKRFALRLQWKSADADQQDVFVGMAQRGATDPEATLAVSNRVGFQVNDGDASILCKCEAADLETSVDSQVDLADNTYKTLGIFYDGSGRMFYEINDEGVAMITTNIPETELLIAIFQLSGNNSGTHSGNARRIQCAVEL